jgi:hypothetical protein
MTGKKILFATDSLAVGGAERQLTLLAKYLPPEWACRVWSLDNGPFAAELRKAGIAVHVSRPRRWDVLPALESMALNRRGHISSIHG